MKLEAKVETHSDDHEKQKAQASLSLDASPKTTTELAETKTGSKDNNDSKDEEQDSDEEVEEEKGRVICNPCDYFDLNTTKYYDFLVIILSIFHYVLNMLIIIDFYDNKDSYKNYQTWFYVFLCFIIFSHICYAFAFGYKYDLLDEAWSYREVTKYSKLFIICCITLAISPFINILIYLTSSEHLILANLLSKYVGISNKDSPVGNKYHLKHYSISLSQAYYTSYDYVSWTESQSIRLFGFLVELVTANFPILVASLVFVTSNVNNMDKNAVRLHTMSIFVNLIAIAVKLFVFCTEGYSWHEYLFRWFCFVTDLFTFVSILCWILMYVLFFICIFLFNVLPVKTIDAIFFDNCVFRLLVTKRMNSSILFFPIPINFGCN